MLLSIIIVNYNVQYFLEQCLHSVLNAARHNHWVVGSDKQGIENNSQSVSIEVIVVDNASTDGSKHYLPAKFPQVKFTWNSENRGFAKANNLALELIARGRYILFLNPDTLLPEDALPKSIALLEADGKNGALGIRMLEGSGRFLPESKRGFPTPAAAFYKLSGLIRLFPRSREIAHYYLGHLPANKNNEVEVLSGAYFMIKKEVLNNIGGFDERFFMYAEDIDLSYRVQQAGYANQYLGECSIVHFKGESTQRFSMHYSRLFYQAMDLFVKKYQHNNQSKAFTAFLRAGILARGGLSAIAKIYRRRKPVSKSTAILHTLIWGTNHETLAVINILNRYKETKRTVVQVSVEKDLVAVCKAQPVDEVIFVAGTLSYNRIINVLQQLPPQITCYFHAAGSGSIVGSPSYKTRGEIMTKV